MINAPLSSQALLLALAMPWLALAAVAIPGFRQFARTLLPCAALPALLAGLLVPDGTNVPLPEWMNSAGFAMDNLARGFLLPAALLWLFAGWFGRGQTDSRLFVGCWLTALGGNLALILAADLLAFYSGFALMTFAAYGLIIHDRDDKAMRAGRLYFVMMLAGELALLTAVSLTTIQAEGLAFGSEAYQGLPDWGLLLFALSFGLKLGAFGLHSWLPVAHPAAPVPASAVLSGIMIKAGLIGWWRVSETRIETLGEWAMPLIILGLAGIFYGAIQGLRAQNPKQILAWSSVSQLGLMVLLAGCVLAEPKNLSAATAVLVLFVLHHGLAKGALFIGTGVMGESRGKHRKTVLLLLCIPALSLAGAPLSGGQLLKVNMDGIVEDTAFFNWLPFVLSLSSLATGMLMARFIILARHWYTSLVISTSNAPVQPWWILLALSLLAPWQNQVTATPGEYVLSLSALGSALWPLIPGVGAALLGIYRDKLRPESQQKAPRRPSSLPPQVAFLGKILGQAEQRLHRWPVVGRALLLLLLALAAVMLMT